MVSSILETVENVRRNYRRLELERIAGEIGLVASCGDKAEFTIQLVTPETFFFSGSLGVSAGQTIALYSKKVNGRQEVVLVDAYRPAECYPSSFLAENFRDYLPIEIEKE